MKKSKVLWILVMALFFALPVLSQTAEPGPKEPDIPTWKNFREKIEKPLSAINENLKSFSMNFELTIAESFLGSGTLVFSKDEFSFLRLHSKNSVCLYLNNKEGSNCFVQNGSNSILFGAIGDSEVPVPIFKIEKGTEEGFRLDLQVFISSKTASMPIQLYIHPEAPSYISERIIKKFPKMEIAGNRVSFFSLQNSTPSLVLDLKDEEIASFTVHFERENGAPITLQISNFNVNQRESEPQKEGIVPQARKMTSGLEARMNFITGFYKMISEFIPGETSN